MPQLELHEQVLVALRRIIRAIDLHSRHLIQCHGMTAPQLVILRRLAAAGEMAIGELADSISLSHPTVTGILSRLERRGLIQRTRGEQDKRQFIIRITDEGKKVLEQAPPVMREIFLKRFGKIQPWEQNQILSSLQRIVDMMEAGEIDAAPYLVSGKLDGPGRRDDGLPYLSDVIDHDSEAEAAKLK